MSTSPEPPNNLAEVHTRAYEIPFFPDLSLPKYVSLFGEQALSVATSRLLGWVKLLVSSGQPFSFILRYRFDPHGPEGKRNRRLRLQILIRKTESAHAGDEFGESMIRTVLKIDSVQTSAIALSESHLRHLAVLSRQEHFSHEAGVVHYRPERWKRSSRSRQALEPFLDEVFDTIDEPAFLDVRVSPVQTTPLNAALRAAIADLETAKEKSYYTEFQRDAYKANLEDLLVSPVCQAVVCAGGTTALTAQRLLQVFAIETTGGTGFEIHHVKTPSRSRTGLLQSGEGGEFFQPFQTDDGWFSRELQEFCAASGGKQRERYRLLSQLRVVASAELLEDFLTLPIPRSGYLRTFPLETELHRAVESASPTPQSKTDLVVLGDDLEHHAAAIIETRQLTKHAFVAGVTGSGKSVTMFNILRQLGEQHIPFVVFEPAKTEYRGLARFSDAFRQHLRVYTPGRERLSPLRLNPFEFSGGIALAEHVANLMAAFQGALPLWEPMPSILEEAIWDLYARRGWSETDGGDCGLLFPRMSDVLPAVGNVLDRFDYDPENDAKFRGAFRSRFVRLTRGSIGRFFDAPRTDPAPEELFGNPTVIELHTLSLEQINLATMFLLITLREHLKSRPANRQLRLAMVLEEAHNLVPATDHHAGEGEVDVKAEATRYVTNMLAEMRALGLSILVVDQTPSAVSPFVMKSTNLKVAHRTVAKDDRETLAHGMLMDSAQQELLGRLPPGQAFMYSEHLYRPVLIANAFYTPEPLCDGDEPSGFLGEEHFRRWLTCRSWYAQAVARRVDTLNKHLDSNLVRAREWEQCAAQDIQTLSSAAPDAGALEQARTEIRELHAATLQDLITANQKAEEELHTIKKTAESYATREHAMPVDGGVAEVAASIQASLQNATLLLTQLKATAARLGVQYKEAFTPPTNGRKA